ncbi:MAG: hypothetical protein K6F69_11090 [Treponema sp.]|nr:hypothetical protein [Treponema sp.]
MDINAICKKIYDIALPFSKKFEAPIAYIEVACGKKFEIGNYSKDDLWREYNKIKWNTPLAASELSIIDSNSSVIFLQVITLMEFEDDNGNSICHRIPAQEGTILLEDS